jgi:hypothetical protein
VIQIIDNFLDPVTYGYLRSYADHADFRDRRSEQDGVVYPNLHLDLPGHVDAEIQERLEQAMGRPVHRRITFMRLSPKGVKAPHQAHSDEIMGQYSLMLYLNRQEDTPRGAGTSFVQHVEQDFRSTPQNERGARAWERDTNRRDAWLVYEHCASAPNRACIFDARLMHRAEPTTGFGRTAQDGRLVLTSFFDTGG